LWPVFLTQLALLRKTAAYVPTNSTHQSNLYRLEACVQEALIEFDAKAGRESFELFKRFSSLLDSFLIEFISFCTRRYITETRPGKPRFQQLPKYLKMINPFSNEYRVFEKEVQEIAKKQKCSPEKIVDQSDCPDFKW